MKAAMLALAALAMAGEARAADVRVTVTGVQARGGHVLVALQTRGQFMKREMSAGATLPGDAAGDLPFVLGDVDPGDYALWILHDADDDKTMTLGPDRRPAEGWTTVGAQALRARPTFDQVVLHVPASGAAVTLPMIYPAR